jgi:redox-sensitive bicupin YhaK (pirin superfamily)
LHRAFGGSNDGQTFDLCLLMDDFRSTNPNDCVAWFPWHLHRGIETITYVLLGHVEHGVSMGNHGSISSGDVQWMTAASGILHQEMPEGDSDGRMYGFQLWANRPRVNTMMDPHHQM